MVHSCSAVNCAQRHEKGISFHSFPKDDVLRKRWIIAMRREKWKPTPSSKLCSRHFKAEDYACSGWSSLKKLKADAVPSVFDFPLHLLEEKKARTAPKRIIPLLMESSEAILNVPVQDNGQTEAYTSEGAGDHGEPRPKKRRKYYFGDFLHNGRSKSLQVAKEAIRRKNELLKQGSAIGGPLSISGPRRPEIWPFDPSNII